MYCSKTKSRIGKVFSYKVYQSWKVGTRDGVDVFEKFVRKNLFCDKNEHGFLLCVGCLPNRFVAKSNVHLRRKTKAKLTLTKTPFFWQIKLTFFAKSFEIVYVNFVTWCNYFYFLIEVNILHTVKNIKMFHCFAEISSFYSPSFRLRVQYQTQPTWVKRLFKLKYKKLLNVHLTDFILFYSTSESVDWTCLFGVTT